jgi:pyroglutamyl-peptidase
LTTQTGILVSGFEPFDGRHVNASWIVANALAEHVAAVQIPVVWGAPARVITSACRLHHPSTIISLGEGDTSGFHIETRARNARKHRTDNHGQLPDTHEIDPDGPSHVHASFATDQLLSLLCNKFPVTLSSDAGQFLCEETLYTLEQLRLNQSGIKHVVFVHVPPYGTTPANQTTQFCDENYYTEFANQLLDAVCGLISDVNAA